MTLLTLCLSNALVPLNTTVCLRPSTAREEKTLFLTVLWVKTGHEQWAKGGHRVPLPAQSCCTFVTAQFEQNGPFFLFFNSVLFLILFSTHWAKLQNRPGLGRLPGLCGPQCRFWSWSLSQKWHRSRNQVNQPTKPLPNLLGLWSLKVAQSEIRLSLTPRKPHSFFFF